MRLADIQAFVGETLLRRYLLVYTQDEAHASILDAVQECGSDGTCLPPTRFGYSPLELDFAPQSRQLTDTAKATANRTRDTFADVDGDGDLDRVFKPAGVNEIHVMRWTGDTLGPAEPWLTSPQSVEGRNVNIFSAEASDEAFIDVNGDGKTDWVWAGQQANRRHIYVALSDGNRFTTPTVWFRDTNALRAFTAEFRPNGFEDFDGDGLLDRVWMPRGRRDLYVALNTGSGFAVPEEPWLRDADLDVQLFSAGANEGELSNQAFVDLNGDGRGDYAWIPNGEREVYVALSEGRSGLPAAHATVAVRERHRVVVARASRRRRR